MRPGSKVVWQDEIQGFVLMENQAYRFQQAARRYSALILKKLGSGAKIEPGKYTVRRSGKGLKIALSQQPKGR